MSDQVRGRTAPEVRWPSDGPTELALQPRPVSTGWGRVGLTPWFRWSLGVLWLTLLALNLVVHGSVPGTVNCAVQAPVWLALGCRASYLRRHPERKNRFW